jgi:sugar phosphate isomerase/epimerase
MKLGVISDSFGTSVRAGIEACASLGLSGMQIYAVKGEFCPENLREEDIESLRALLKEKGLEVSALCGDLGGHGFEIASEVPTRVEKTKKIIDLALKFDSKIVTTHIGVIPEDKTSEKYQTMLGAMKELGKYASERGATLAIETGPEVAVVLNDFVRAAGDGVGVNLDPANFVMVTGQDPAEAVRILSDKIVHTHVKDGKMLKKSDPVLIYKCFAEGGIEALNVADFFVEVPVGEGDVNWDEYIGALREVGYNGYLTIERECGDDPAADIKKAADFIRCGGYLS